MNPQGPVRSAAAVNDGVGLRGRRPPRVTRPSEPSVPSVPRRRSGYSRVDERAVCWGEFPEVRSEQASGPLSRMVPGQHQHSWLSVST